MKKTINNYEHKPSLLSSFFKLLWIFSVTNATKKNSQNLSQPNILYCWRQGHPL